MQKECSRCHQEKDFEEFPRNDGMRTGRDSICRVCRRTLSADQRRKDREGRPPSLRHVMSGVDPRTRIGVCSICGPGTKAWQGGGKTRARWRCSNRVQGQVSRAKERDPTLERVRKLRANGVKITVEEYQQLVAKQNGRCALCASVPRGLHVDHDHDTGKVRGLLCSTCNTGLGKFSDDPEKLEAAALYLRENS